MEMFSMKKKAFGLLITGLLVLIISGVIACAPAITYDETEVRAYADPATETTLQGFSEGNLAKYTQYGNAQFKEAVTQQIFDDMIQELGSKFGSYVSKDFMKTRSYQDYILVYYKAKFTRVEVTVRMVFDQDHLVAGQWFE